MKKLKNSIIISCCVLSFVACSSSTEVPELLEPVGMEMDTAVVVKQELIVSEEYTANVVPYIEEIALEYSGVVYSCDVLLGDEVLEGDVLIELDLTSIQSQIEQKESQMSYNATIYDYTNRKLELAIETAELYYEHLLEEKNEYESYCQDIEEYEDAYECYLLALEAYNQAEDNQDMLLPEPPEELGEVVGPVTDSDLVLAQAAVESAQLALDQTIETQTYSINLQEEELAELKASIEESEIVAPFSGTIVYFKNLLMGDSIRPSETVIALADESRLQVTCEYINNTIFEKVEKIVAHINGMEYELDYVEMTTAEYIALTLAEIEVTTAFEFVEIDEAVQGGDFVSLELITNIVEDALVIPINAIYGSYSTGYYVYKIVDDTMVRTEVTCGDSSNVYMQITEGLEEGDVVYVQE